MIELVNACKRYGSVEAVKDISFRAHKGQILGLLGQNGAGKTTTLNMLTGYFPPTAGQVLVDDMDMLARPRACKRLIGYLPEKPPLYDEMTVEAYLRFVCELREVAGKAIPGHVKEIMRLCGLEDMSGRLVGSLSKGYRQRVGVAQALCGDPPVIVLDEPTVGLDPRQVVEIRALIRELGRKHIVIFSSHLLSEIQQLCQRVIILHKGCMVYDAELNEIAGEGGVLRLRASIAAPDKQLLPALKGLPCMRRVKALPSALPGLCEVEMECDRAGGGREEPHLQLHRLLCAMDAPLHMLMPCRDTLEEVFLRVTAESPAVGKEGDAT